MARYTFGKASSDWLVSIGLLGALAAADGELTAWTAPTGGTQLTDLQNVAGAAVTSVAAARGQYAFKGPDGVRSLWIDGGSGERELLVGSETWTELAQVLDLGGAVPDATTTTKGIARRATAAEVSAGSDVPAWVNPARLLTTIEERVPAGTTDTPGKVQLATPAEGLTGTSTSRVTSVAVVRAMLDALIAAAPGALDTLDELAAALGDDPNFATTITNLLAGKVSTSALPAGVDARLATPFGLIAVGGTRDGVADDRDALSIAAASAAAAGISLTLQPGTYRVASNLTIAADVIAQPGAVIKPDSGVTVTITGTLTATDRRIADHSAGGLVVPRKVPVAYNPAWWGATGGADDTVAWKDMLAAAAASATAGARQTVRVPAGTTRIWGVDAANVHLDASGMTRLIKPALSRVTTGGYMLQLQTLATITGGEWHSDAQAGIQVIRYTGARAWIDRAYVRPLGTDTIGINATSAAGGSITPRIVNTIVYSGDGGAGSGGGTGTGLGIIVDSPDAELTNTWVGFVGYGIKDLRGSGTWTGVHVWGCTTDGARLSDNTRVLGGYFETNGGWGLDMDGADNCQVVGTTVWANGQQVANTGGVRLSGAGSFCTDNVLDLVVYDNVGDGVLVQGSGASRNDIRVMSTSARVRAGQAPVTVNAVRIDATAGSDNHVRIRGDKASVTGSLVLDGTGGARIDRGRITRAVTTPVAAGPLSTAYVTALTIPMKAGQTWSFRGTLFVDGPQAADLKVRVQATSATGVTGHFSAHGPAASNTSLTGASVNPSNAAAIAPTGGNGVTVGLLGAGTVQAIPITGWIKTDTTAGTLELQIAANAVDATAVNLSYADLIMERIA